jgi:ABC-type bacteriocin/lantibiotic exporter with double-glycine peptidase domain
LRLQSTQANCGPACLRNALLCHGINRSEQELEQLAGTTGTNGTSGKGLIKALSSIAQEHPNVRPGVIAEGRADVAILKLLAALDAGHVIILCADNDEHWILAFGTLGSGARVLIHVCDPAENEMVLHMRPEALLARWKGPGRKPYYGVIV